MEEPHDHHFVPQFVLRRFAADGDKNRIVTLAKDGNFAIWMERSIKGIGWEHDFYVHTVGGVPISVETAINSKIETPVSDSPTWAKVIEGHTRELDFSDRPILYGLVRHLEARSPHFLSTGDELAAMAADPNSEIPFSEEEREMFAFFRAHPEARREMFNFGALRDFAAGYERSLIMVKRSPIKLRSSTTPVLASPFENVPGLDLPLPGMVPFQRVMAIDPYTLVSVVVGDFGGAFINFEMPEDEARDYNRVVAAQFAKFPMVRHMVCGQDRLAEDMAWAGYDFIRDTPLRKVFKRRLPDQAIGD